MYDIAVINPLQLKYIYSAGLTHRVAADGAVAAKCRKNASFSDLAHVDFVPLAVECFGRWDSQLHFNQLARRLSMRTGTRRETTLKQILQKLSYELQRGNAHCLMQRQEVPLDSPQTFPMDNREFYVTNLWEFFYPDVHEEQSGSLNVLPVSSQYPIPIE